MTNLTDEGLRAFVEEMMDNLPCWSEGDNNEGVIIEAGADIIVDRCVAILKQVRDAAKKEMKERAAKVAEDTCLLCGQKNVSAQVEGQDRGCTAMSKPHLTSQLGATAIRQMGGGE